ncbi:MAG: hypothetical protein KDD39_06000 [Bdellovibrionales bacterium]|nr:hypothetical protein [Bdellovibrionales bacterium]
MRTKFFLIIVMIGIGFSSLSLADNAGLGISGAVDLYGGFGSNGPSQFDVLREAELIVYSPADYLFDGRLGMAAHLEGGDYFFELHEAFISSTKLIPRSRIKVGQFFLGVGRLNQIHRHDWAFVTAPKAHTRFFDQEGVLDLGVEFGTLFPLPFFLDLTVGVTSGRKYGHVHGGGSTPRVPTHYLRLVSYADLANNSGFQVGLNYLGRVANDGTKKLMLGLDLVGKWRDNQRLAFLLQSEAWYRAETPPGNPVEREFSVYLYPQYGFTETLYLGLRGDLLVNLDSNEVDHNIVPTLSWKPSEFTTFRAAYNFQGTRRAGVVTAASNYAELQAIFLLGAHPAHVF